MKTAWFHIIIVLLGFFLQVPCASGQPDPYLNGMARLQARNYQSALEFFELAALESGENADLLIRIGEAQYMLGNYGKALDNFNRVNALISFKASLWLAKCYAMEGRNAESIKALQDHLNSEFKVPEKTIVLDPAFGKLERTREWRNLWRKEWYSPFEYTLLDAEYMIQKKAYSEAVEKLNLLIGQQDEDAFLYFCRGRARMGAMNLRPAVEDLNRAIELDNRKAEFFAARAGLYKQLREYQSALTDLDRALDLDPSLFNLHLDKAGILEIIDRSDKAIHEIDTYLDYFGDDPEALLMAGEALHNSGHFFRALNYLNRGLESDKDNEALYLERGRVYLIMNTYQFAENDFTMALDLNPDNSDTYLKLGMTRLGLNKISEACYDFRKAFRMGAKDALPYLQKYCDFLP